MWRTCGKMFDESTKVASRAPCEVLWAPESTRQNEHTRQVRRRHLALLLARGGRERSRTCDNPRCLHGRVEEPVACVADVSSTPGDFGAGRLRRRTEGSSRKREFLRFALGSSDASALRCCTRRKRLSLIGEPREQRPLQSPRRPSWGCGFCN